MGKMRLQQKQNVKNYNRLVQKSNLGKRVSFPFSGLSVEMGWLMFAMVTYNITRTPGKRI